MPARPMFVLLVALALPTAQAAAPVRYEGQAFAARGGALLYRETHWLYRDGGVPARLVLYRCPDGRPFARKAMREVAGPLAPDFDYLDARTGHREGVRTREGRREVFHRRSAGARLETRPLQATPGLVVDAGFDAYVRSNWTRLGRGGVAVPFLLPSRFEAVGFRLDAAGTATEGGRPVRRLRMSLDGLLGRALPAVELTYDAATRRLLRFQGLGSVRDARGRLQSVRVEFPQPPVTAGVDAGEIAAASGAALVASCGG